MFQLLYALATKKVVDLLVVLTGDGNWSSTFTSCIFALGSETFDSRLPLVIVAFRICWILFVVDSGLF